MAQKKLRPEPILGLVLLLCVQLGCSRKPEQFQGSQQKQVDLTNVPTDFSMPAKELYDNSQDKKYAGKVVELTGEVSFAYGGLSRGDNPPKPYLRLMAGAADKIIDCETVDPQPWAKIVPHQNIKVKGRFTGGRTLEDCVIIDYGTDLAITMRPEDLVKEYKADPKATNEKYFEKYLRMEGDVVSLKKGGESKYGTRGVDLIVLKSSGGTQIECLFNETSNVSYGKDKMVDAAEGHTHLKIVGQYHSADKGKVELWQCRTILP